MKKIRAQREIETFGQSLVTVLVEISDRINFNQLLYLLGEPVSDDILEEKKDMERQLRIEFQKTFGSVTKGYGALISTRNALQAVRRKRK